MSIKFKKGHIIPRWCHVVSRDRKAQHNFKFGCDVEVSVSDGVVVVKMLTDGAVISTSGTYRTMKNGTKKKSPAFVRNLHCDASLFDSGMVVDFSGDVNKVNP